MQLRFKSLYTPMTSREGAVCIQGPVGDPSYELPYRRLCGASGPFTLSWRRWRNRRRPGQQRGERLGGENETPADPPVRVAGGSAAAVSPWPPSPLSDRCPGPVPAPLPTSHLVNKDRQMVERKKEGDFVARPIFSRQVSELYYSIRHPGHRRVGHPDLPGAGRASKQALRGLGVHLRVSGPGRAARPGPGAGFPAGPGSAPALAAASATYSTPWSPSTSPRGCGTGCWAP